MSKVLLLTIIFTIVGCSSRQPVSTKKNIVKNIPRKVILFIPGYYGSKLRDQSSNELLWAKASSFLFSQNDLADFVPGTTIGPKRSIVVDGILEDVTIIPRLFSIDSYGSSIKQLREFSETNNYEFETVAYDWRDDFIGCLKVIDQKIKSLNIKKDDEFIIVAHSMGGTLAAYYLRYGAQDVEAAKENWEGLSLLSKLVLVAPPLHGLMVLFRDVGEGTSQGLNRNLLSARDYSTFKSSYFFLPSVGDDQARNEKGELVSLNLHSVETWEKNKWGLFKFATDAEIPAVRVFMEKYMKRSEKFHTLMTAPVKVSPMKKIPLLHMWGVGKKTLEIADLTLNEEGRINYEFNDHGRVDGDGTVTKNSGRSLEFFQLFDLTAKEEKDGHLDILSHEKSQKTIHQFILK